MQKPFERNDEEFERLLSYGIAALKGGDKAQARRWLEKATRIRTTDARPWLWLSGTTENVNEQRTFLERAVSADPANAAARRGLVMLSEKLDKTRLMEEGQGIQASQPSTPEEAETREYTCPNCGGQMQFNIHAEQLTCIYCAYAFSVESQPAADSAEQPIDFVLPTTRAHRWSEAQQRVACQNCGSVTLLEPDQRSDQCPYCGSNRLVATQLQVEWVDPQAIGVMKIDQKQAQQQVRAWLGKGWFAPDDLLRKAGAIQLRAAYYPFWTFDGTLEIPWSCEVNEGTSKNPRWVSRVGTEFQFFDDVLISGLRSLRTSQAAAIEPFQLKELVEFSPDYLAGWLALNYDLPLADASLLARQKVVKTIRKDLYFKIEPGREKRNISTGAGQWSGMTFKHILLPLWVGNYLYQGKSYRVLINGQTGKVGGEKPRDRVKIALYIILGLLALGLLLALVYWLLTQMA